jgi:hypothetical protein
MAGFRWPVWLGVVVFCAPMWPLAGVDLQGRGKGDGGCAPFTLLGLREAGGSPGLAEFDGWYRRTLAELACLERTGVGCRCLAPPAGTGPAAPHWEGASAPARHPSGRAPRGVRNLVVEVRRIGAGDTWTTPAWAFR